MPLGFLLKAIKGIDFDSDELYKSQNHAAFIKNMSIDPNDNPSNQGGVEGDNLGVFTPTPALELVMPANFTLPEGDNYCIGYEDAKELNEGYVFVFNSKKNHCIYRINGNDGSLQMVKIDPDFNFQLDPRYFITPGRCVVISYCYFNKASNREERRKELYFTDHFGPMRYLNIEDCIATDGFNANKFSFFKFFKPYKEFLINNGLPYSFACVGITPVPTTDADKVLDNRINDKQFKFRIKWIDVWGRESEHGVISSPYKNANSGCLPAGITRCLDLTIDAGPPTIDKIQIEFNTCSGNAQNLTVESDWAIAEIIDKYDQSNTNLQWWQRPINPDLKYNATANIFTYRFCNDKDCKAIPVAETNRRFNPIPITTGSVFAINKGIGVANNRKKYPQLPKKVLQSLSFSVEKPTQATTCAPKGINISVYALLYCDQEKHAVALFKDGDNILFGADKVEFVIEAGQILPKGQEGIIGYFAGTSEYVVSKQYRRNMRTGEMVEVGLDYAKGVDSVDLAVNYIPVQKWEFKNVTPGKRIFRVASHKASPADDYQRTSTTVYGLTYIRNVDNYAKQRDINVKELVIDACDKDLDLLDDPFMICDITRDNGRITNGISGYLYEDEVNKIPIEKARVDTTEVATHPVITDYNGFFWSVNRKKSWRIKLYGTKNGERNQFLGQTEETFDAPGARYRNNTIYVYKNTQEYPAKDRITIKGKILFCNTNTGLGGVPVLLTNGQATVTDNNGNYTLIAHDGTAGKYDAEDIIIGQGGKCLLTTCDNRCTYCFPTRTVYFPLPTSQPRILQQPDVNLSVQNLNMQGPQNGGRYELGLVAFDWLGRTNGFENLSSHFVDIPAIQETGVFGFSKIRYKFNAATVFPDYVKNVTLAIGRNLNWQDFMMWYAEKIELIDNSGKINKVNPTQIKVYYRGMIEYSAKNGNRTNSTWQFIDTDGNPIVGDRVEFVANGDGKIFTSRISSLVRADTAGSFFTIDYSDELRSLTDGALMKLIRPKICEQTNIYYESCLEIELVNHKIPTNRLEGVLPYVDSYMVSRQIPIPFYNDKGERDDAQISIKNVAFPFEHASPSDFWGDHCNSRGRGFAKDPYATIQCRSTEIGVSKALVNDGLINGLSYFSDSDFKEFDKQEWGSITFVQPFIGGMLVICEQDNFVIGFDEDSVRAAADGRIIAKPADERFGRPERKIGSKFGCQPWDINTISVYEGFVTFLDASKSAWVLHNYSEANDMSLLGCNGWLKDKVKHMMEYNRTHTDTKKYFHGAFDPRSEQSILTSFKLPVYSSNMAKLTIQDYVNELREINIERNETIGVNPFEKAIKQQYGFTPEYFGPMIGHHRDKQLFVFKGAQPYLLHKQAKNLQQTTMNFFGVQCEPVYEVVLNVEPQAVKRFMCTEVFCKEQLFFCDRIITQAGQSSRLMVSAFEKREHFWVADFKGDLNTLTDTNSAGLKDPAIKIMEGNSLYGKWIRLRYVGYPKQNGKYFEFDGVSVGVFRSEKSGITK